MLQLGTAFTAEACIDASWVKQMAGGDASVPSLRFSRDLILEEKLLNTASH